jgi:iron complex transport system ATP-binding protein
MLPALAGHVDLLGDDLAALDQAERARRRAVVLTERPAVGSLHARRVVELGRYPRIPWFGRLAARDHTVVDRALEATGAGHLAERDFSRLSDGERQKVMIARALAQEPQVLILDEPTSFLDAAARVEVLALLGRLARENGLAVLLSSHDLELALRAADTVWLLMPDGRVRTGAPEDLVLAGEVAAAFASGEVAFNPEGRSFRLVRKDRGRAAVVGKGQGAALARAVLEREGYAVMAPGSEPQAPLRIQVDAAGQAWRASGDGDEAAGATFAALAAHLRRLAEVKARRV